jgi:cell division protein FtsI (penicillin-binding protein 3)
VTRRQLAERTTRAGRRGELRRQLLLGVWLLAAGAVVARAGQVQVLDRAEWRAAAEGQHRLATALPAARGTIYDRHGTPIAVSQERYRIELDADQLPQRDSVRRVLREVVGLPARKVEELTDPERDWAVVPGRHAPSVREHLDGLRGVWLYRELQRDYPYEAVSAGILGRLQEGAGSGGIEQTFEEILAGVPGRLVVARDGNQKPIPGQIFELRPPVDGGDVHLTIDLDLQEIGHQALTEAIETYGASGGDLVVVDPRTGEILALVSIRADGTLGLSAVNTPYEPGSTIKPFTVAALLEHTQVRLGDRFEIGDGSWTINGRTIRDDHADSTELSLRDALRVSSNIGIAKAAQALTPGQQYEALRDFGFGVRTGIPLPGEAPGTLRRPEDWFGDSPQSLAIGYEIGVTPLQMAMAYGALANGGRLLEARLVSATRPPEGSVRRFEPTVIRKVMSGAVTGQIRDVLVDVVEDGTGTRAQLATFAVAGKTGTSKVYDEERRGYAPGEYFASFGGFFPAEAPQLVIFVKLDAPKGASYYGGATAAPVTRATMEAALAVRNSPLDRGALLSVSRQSTSTPSVLTPFRFAGIEGDAGVPERRDPAPDLPHGPDWEGPREATIPDVADWPERFAARRLHQLGFRVEIDRSGGRGLVPKPGTVWPVGGTVLLRTGRADR